MANERRLTSPEAWSSATIDDYVEDVGIVWGKHDVNRSMIDIWLRVVQRASGLGELVRRRRYNEAKEQLGRIAIWMLTFVAKGRSNAAGLDSLFRLQRPLSEMLWRKYPNCCAACFTRRVGLAGESEDWEGGVTECDCILTLAETEERNQTRTPEEKAHAATLRREYADKHSGETGHYAGLSLTALEETFALIFKRNIFALDLEHMTFHFLEEVGEVVEAITGLYTYPGFNSDTPVDKVRGEWERARSGLEDELADAFSWLFAVSSKFRDLFEVIDSYTGNTCYAGEMKIASHLQDRHMHPAQYLMKCWDCGSTECTCPIKLVTEPGEAEALARPGD